MSVAHLHRAKKAKSDEFYTRLTDIEKELSHYKDQLKDKWVYSPADDFRWSNFVRYFTDHFQELGLRHFTATNYDIGDGAYRYDYDGENTTVTQLEGDGDFRSEECTRIKDECDIVISNFPFSLFRDCIYWLNDGTFHKNKDGKVVRDE